MLTAPTRAAPREAADAILGGTLFLDVEVDRAGRPRAVGAVLGDRVFRWEGHRTAALARLTELDAFARGAERIAGHNILDHDLPILRDAVPGLGVLALPVVDTLMLSPLAFPGNPYHRLIKGYKLVHDAVNDPVADARLCRDVLRDELFAFALLARTQPEVAAFHRFAWSDDPWRGMADLLAALGAPGLPTPAAALEAWARCAGADVCVGAVERLDARQLEAAAGRPAFAYALAWLTVAGGSSVVPAWVRRQWPDTARLLAHLRDTPCGSPRCPWCRSAFDAVHWLTATFGFDAFRPEPAAPDGGSLQQRIVEAGLAGRPHLAVLPTGAGKSLCFQVPALARHSRTGALTVVVSPLQALMKDQVDNLEAKTGRLAAAALYGTLTLPERGAVMDRVRKGDVAVLYVSPEQLRNPSVARTLAQRDIATWVFDEAHCLSKWGHDFRPDYLYAARFIAELAERQGVPPPPVSCLTATAKHEVIEEIVAHFRERLGQELALFVGGVERPNLAFAVEAVDEADKTNRIAELLARHLPRGDPAACAVVYAATRRRTEEIRDDLTARGWDAAAYHAGLRAPEKLDVQEGFVAGAIRVVCATNAFGMGIDKDSVRLVVHADVPGSLEAYMQEAGRAGRDRRPATCVLLFTPEDLEKQFRLAALSELTRRDVAQVLRGARRLARALGRTEVVATTGELIADPDLDLGFDAEDGDADTKVKTALSWLERAGLLERNENRTWVVTARPRPLSLDEARQKIAALALPLRTTQQWMAVFRCLVAAGADSGEERSLTMDELARLPALAEETDGPPNLATARVQAILAAMARQGLIESGTVLTALVRPAGSSASRRVFAHLVEIGQALLDLLREENPDEAPFTLELRAANQRLHDRGCVDSQPDLVRRLLKTLNEPERAGTGGARLRLTVRAHGRYSVAPVGGWSAVVAAFRTRSAVARLLLDHLLGKAKAAEASGRSIVPFTLEELAEAVGADLLLAADCPDPVAAAQAALLMLHDWKAIILQGGLSVFRQGLTLRLPEAARARRYTVADHEPLARHYRSRALQIHAMGEFARLGLTDTRRALAFAADYFSLPEDRLVARHFPGRKTELARPVTPETFARIVTDLRNSAQEAIVTASPGSNLLVLAGPGSGKTRVIVHRCAWLMRVRRVPARAILVLCFNHAAALEVRRRLRGLVGEEGAWVDAHTYHALAMRLIGASFAERVERGADAAARSGLDGVVRDATALLRGERDLPGLDAEEIRERLLARYRYILIDEYQDIDEDQYNLVSTIAGRQEKEPEGRIALLAVGDDDQSVYRFRGANVGFIRRFREDYNAQVHHLVENYRSTAAIIAAAGAVIAANAERMKPDHPIRIDGARAGQPDGGRWAALDPAGRGRVRRLAVDDAAHQLGATLAEVRRLRTLAPETVWSAVAVLARTRHDLMPVHALCEQEGLPCAPVYDRDGERFPLHRLREVSALLERMRRAKARVTDAWLRTQVAAAQADRGPSPWWRLVTELLDQWAVRQGGAPAEPERVREFLYEALAQRRRERSAGSGIFIGTLHGAKGLEFRHVLILDGGWGHAATREEAEEERRLFYVGMTRARETLCLLRRGDARHPHLPLLDRLDLDRAAAQAADRADPALLNRRRHVIGLGDLYIGFAGRLPPGDWTHQALAALRPGDRVSLDAPADAQRRVSVRTADGVTVARLSTAASERWARLAPSIAQARVLAMVKRNRTDDAEEWRDRVQVTAWEIPILEVWTNAAG
ncbi:RecQ family ATP-dependent DNA helicase [Azospirillum canadense]|uniref:RecQ family ATP-dependent DNA helicase n=1 Tax=Azospirillum canadense TaxID=403962 RepID=UPI0022264B6F|nr:RecQ family ATP-dependent DNA helicase [Azospirillum canadense]MCW2239067.1 ATP-dependent DNA helicase RecQ [Azospirillum canadense]